MTHKSSGVLRKAVLRINADDGERLQPASNDLTMSSMAWEGFCLLVGRGGQAGHKREWNRCIILMGYLILLVV